MRLWHKDLIDVLPRKQLLAQWRECCAIAGKIAKTGSPNHMLVNKVTEYSQIHFIEYTNRILNEMHKRSYKVSESSFLRFIENLKISEEYFYDVYNILINKDFLFPGWMDERYFKQCYYNLQEKYDCGGISEEDWNLIARRYENFIKENKE